MALPPRPRPAAAFLAPAAPALGRRGVGSGGAVCQSLLAPSAWCAGGPLPRRRRGSLTGGGSRQAGLSPLGAPSVRPPLTSAGADSTAPSVVSAAATTTPSPPSPVAAATELLAALVAAGGTVSPALAAAPAGADAPGRAVVAVGTAVGGAGRTALLQLPLDALLTPEAAAELLPSLPSSSLLDDYALLSLALIYLRANPGAGGPLLAAYVAGLPYDADLDVPLLWADEELAFLEGSVLGEQAARMKTEVAAEWAALDGALLDPARDAFPAAVYTADAYAWSAAVVVERGLSLPGYPLVLAPAIDLATGVVGGAAEGAVDIVGTGLFGRTKVVQLSAPAGGLPAGATVAGVTAEAAAEGRSFRDLFLEAGVVAAAPAATAKDADKGGVVGLSFGLSPEDGQYDDKVDILETYAYPGEAAGDEDEDGEERVFPLAAAPAGAGYGTDDASGAGEEGDSPEDGGGVESWSRDSWTPPADLMPFLRLVMLGGGDVFLLEAVFRPEVWGFMAYPVSEDNEAAAIDAILAACATALDGYAAAPAAEAATAATSATTTRRAALARRLVGVETSALRACVAYFTRERATLDSVEYYQERRLRELNLLRPVDPSEIVDSESGGRAAAAFDEYY